MRILFAGTPLVAASVLKGLADAHEIGLVLTRPDSEVGRKRVVTPSCVASVATERGLPILKANRIGESEIEAIRSAKLDLAVVVAYGSIIPRPALDLFPWWNLHFSLLPAWRGATPLQHSLISGSGQGITLFQLEPTLDTGPIIDSLPLQLPDDEPAGTIMSSLAGIGTSLILDNLRNPKPPKPQQGEVSLAPKIERMDAKLDFSQSAMDLQRMVFAFNPEPMAWCRANERDLRILKARAVGSVDWNSIGERKLRLGEIELSQGKVLVGCGLGTRLELIEVHPAGGKPMLATDWQRGFGGLSLE